MLRIKRHFFLLLVLLVSFGACNNAKKIYESGETSSKKKKSSTFALTKYNKLLKSNDTDAKFTAAKNYFEKKDYDRALPLLEGLLTIYRGTSYAEETQYMYAFANYYIGDYIVAGYQFKTFVKNFPNSKHRELCAYTNALCYFQYSPEFSLDQKDTYIAIEEFQRFINQFPKSEYIASCNAKLDELRNKLDTKSYQTAMLYYKMDNYQSAVTAFRTHIAEFSDTKHKEELDFLTIKSYYLLAINSIESKKDERFKATIESYLKFVDSYPNSSYLKEAENIYSEALKKHKKSNKSTS